MLKRSFKVEERVMDKIVAAIAEDPQKADLTRYQSVMSSVKLTGENLDAKK